MAHPFKPTDEQIDARDKFKTGKSLKIRAFAGSGKTSTLTLLAQSRNKRGIYIAFNRSIADDARYKFPQQVDCRTMHSIAWRAIAGRGFDTSKMSSRVNPLQLASLACITGASYRHGFRLTPVQRAFLALKTIIAFCQSASADILPDHMPTTGRLAALGPDIKTDIRKDIAQLARSIWKRMIDRADPLPLSHDGYLKLWALGQPRIPADFILLDEAQDTNGVVLGVLAEQRAQLVCVGDSHQAIYEWRGAIDALSRIASEETAYLTRSFRFGDDIADLGSRILRTLGEKKPLRGNPDIPSLIAPVAENHTVLARTNSYVMAETIGAMQKGKKVHIIGGTDEPKRLISDVFALKAGRHASSPELFGFTDWSQVEEFAETDEGEEIKPLVWLVNEYGEDTLMDALSKVKKEEWESDIIVSTAHKSKGREFPSVRIASDFDPTSGGRDEPDISDAEARLFYVAITRAQRVLEVDPLIVRSYLQRERSEPNKSAAWPTRHMSSQASLDFGQGV